MKILPNLITVFRLFLIMPLYIYAKCENHVYVLYLHVAAGISDFLDGHLARTYSFETTLGKYLDGLIDKVYLFCLIPILYIYYDMNHYFILFVFIREVLNITFGIRLRNNILKHPQSTRENDANTILFEIKTFSHKNIYGKIYFALLLVYAFVSTLKMLFPGPLTTYVMAAMMIGCITSGTCGLIVHYREMKRYVKT